MISKQARPAPRNGFTLIEVLIAAFVIGTAVVGLFGLFVLTLRSAQEGERRVAAVALANERVEMARNLPYAAVGTQGGLPAGAIPQRETVQRNGVTYTVRTDVRYVDDPYDGTAGESADDEEQITICHRPPGGGQPRTLVIGAAAWPAHQAHGDTEGSCEGGPGTSSGDAYNADFKQVRVEVSWNSPYAPKPVLLISYVVPDGVEGSEAGGTLDFQALDAAGAGVSPATVRLLNDAVSPAVDLTTQTNAEGRLVLPGLPPSAGTYELTVSQDGYTTEQTYDATADFIPDADHAHLSAIVGEVTQKTFVIDRVSTLTMLTQDEEGKKIGRVAYQLQGTKTIGVDGEGEPVLVMAAAGETSAAGRAEHEDLVWDTYTISIDGEATQYDIQETNLLLPLVVDPGAALELVVTLTPHTLLSLHVTVTSPDGQPVDNATVRLAGAGVDESKGTGVFGQVFFADLPEMGDYSLSIEAPGFTPYTAPVSVEGTARTTAALTPVS